MMDLSADNVNVTDECTYGDYTVSIGLEDDDLFVNVQNKKSGMNNTYYFDTLDDADAAFGMLYGVLDEILKE